MFSPTNYRYGNMQLRFLDTIGDGLGSVAMNVNGSITPVEFKVVCPANNLMYLESVSVFLQDTGAFTAGDYGAVPKLTNGIKILIRRNGTLVADVTGQVPIKSNADWMSYSFQTNNFDFAGGQSVLALNYNLAANGRPLMLSAGDSFVVIVRDDLTGLTEHRVRTSSVFVPIL